MRGGASEKIVAALEAGQPPDFAFALRLRHYLSQWAFDDRLVDLTDTVGHFSDLFDPDMLARGRVRNPETGQKALYGLPMGRSTNHLHVWKSLLEQCGFHPRGHPEGVGGVLVVLVRPGAARRARRPCGATTSGASR